MEERGNGEKCKVQIYKIPSTKKTTGGVEFLGHTHMSKTLLHAGVMHIHTKQFNSGESGVKHICTKQLTKTFVSGDRLVSDAGKTDNCE